MKRLIYSATQQAIEVDYIDRDLIDHIYQEWNAQFDNGNPESVKPVMLKISPNCEGDPNLNLKFDDLYNLKQRLSPSNFKKVKEILSESQFKYDPQLHRSLSSEAKQIYREIAANIKAMKIPYLKVEAKPTSCIVYYDPDLDKYSSSSAAYQDNCNEIEEMLNSIPCVVVSPSEIREQAGWKLVWDIRNDDTDITYEPSITSLDPSSGVTYKVYISHAPEYMSRTKFRYARDSQEMYMVDSITLKCDDDSVSSFVDALEEVVDLEGFNAYAINSWDTLFELLDSSEYVSNGAVIVSTNIVKIVRTSQGKSKTIYSRELP